MTGQDGAEQGGQHERNLHYNLFPVNCEIDHQVLKKYNTTCSYKK
jgi:hypothetical protein